MELLSLEVCLVNWRIRGFIYVNAAGEPQHVIVSQVSKAAWREGDRAMPLPWECRQELLKGFSGKYGVTGHAT